MKMILGLVALILLAVGAYFLLQPKNDVKVETPVYSTPSTPTTNSSPTPTPQKPDANTGAAGVSNPSAHGTAAECNQCSQYSGAEKAQCLVALNC